MPPQTQTDPWEQAAKNYQPQAGGVPKDSSGEDWKIWQQTDAPSLEQRLTAPEMAPPNESAGHHVVRALSNIGGGVIGSVAEPIMHPIKTAESAFSMSPLGMIVNGVKGAPPPGSDLVQSFKEHPEETAESGLGSLIGAADVGGLAGEVGDALPSKARAGATLEQIRGKAQNVPVRPNNAWPQIERFQELTKRGGSTAKPATQLSARLQNMVRLPQQGDFTFPEARDFYSNVSSQSAEDMSRLNPIMRRQMGAIRSGLHQDLTDAAGTIGRGEDYAAAVKEYANAMKLRQAAIKAAKVAVPVAGIGIAGHYLKDLIPSR